jgi:hypothetical protein
MTTLTISIIVVFVLGYALIATESLTKVNKAAIALLMLVGCWTLYMVDPMQYLQLMHPDYTGGAAGMVEKVTGIIQEHLGDTATTLFFLMGAMTIVEIVDQNGGFNWVRKVMKTKSKRALLWRIAILTFFLSAILDNLTTSIVMIMILRKLVTDHKDRMVYASLVIIAANSGGAFSPIGDVTTIMLWNKGLITAAGVIAEIFIPSVVSMVIPALILQTMLKGENDSLPTSEADAEHLYRIAYQQIFPVYQAIVKASILVDGPKPSIEAGSTLSQEPSIHNSFMMTLDAEPYFNGKAVAMKIDSHARSQSPAPNTDNHQQTISDFRAPEEGKKVDKNSIRENIVNMMQLLKSRYDFRYNTVMKFVEYMPKDKGWYGYQPVDPRVQKRMTLGCSWQISG